MLSFGEFVKNIRIKQGITLREFCKSTDLDPSNWSKIERNILQPPKSKEILLTIANFLKLTEETDLWNTLFELALIGHIPSELINDKKVVEKLPVFFRTLNGQKPNRAELEDLIRLLKESL